MRGPENITVTECVSPGNISIGMQGGVVMNQKLVPKAASDFRDVNRNQKEVVL